MVAVDTNVLVRLLTGDDPTQEAIARTLFSTGSVWIGKTVMLETAWVLGSLYEFEDSAIREAFKLMMGLRNVEFEDLSTIVAAIELSGQGLEFADALHLSSKPFGIPFASFDKTFIKRARKAGVTEVSALPGNA